MRRGRRAGGADVGDLVVLYGPHEAVDRACRLLTPEEAMSDEYPTGDGLPSGRPIDDARISLTAWGHAVSSVTRISSEQELHA